ncbi:unnamed protein product [Malus baccata var. baccata]
MASKCTLSLFTITFLFVLLSLFSHATSSETHNKNTSPFEFLNHLKGCHKGDKRSYCDRKEEKVSNTEAAMASSSGLNNAEPVYKFIFLLTTSSSPFGFLEHLKGCHKGDKVKGIPDLKKYLEHFGYLYVHSNDNDLDDQLESSIKTYQLNYSLNSTGKLDAETVPNMMKRAHGDRYPFDGRGRVLAHSFAVADGRFHYDTDERWAVDVVTVAYDLLSVAWHEIGYLLGLGHSSVRGAVMLLTISSGFTRRRLSRDDISGINALYTTLVRR